jgi:hypothetical protein
MWVGSINHLPKLDLLVYLLPVNFSKKLPPFSFRKKHSQSSITSLPPPNRPDSPIISTSASD